MSEPEKQIRQYYQRIYLDTSQTCYIINRKGGTYLGTAKTLEEALYYRDLYSESTEKNVPKPQVLDLKTNNPYLINGLKYSIPKRLQTPPDYKPYTPKGSIYQRTKSCYTLYYSKTYLCTCRTYEQAYYVLGELRKHNWDKNRLPEIFDSYPEWYTSLMELYRYITIDQQYKNKNSKKYVLNIPREYLAEGKTLDTIRGYTNIEDALFERDFLEQHEWDYELLVEQINDLENPYYDMDLPPYPERKIRNLRKRKTHAKEIRQMQEIILENPDIQQKELSEKLNTSGMNIRNWLRNYNTNWLDFKTLILAGDDPLEKLELKRIIYKPDLSPSMPKNFKGYIHKNKASKKYPYIIVHKKKSYGYYPDRKIALKVVKDLIACNWDHSQLKKIQRSHGYIAVHGSKNLIYKDRNTYRVRKTLPDGRLGNYGCYPCQRLAEIVRDLLKKENWNKKLLPSIKEFAKYIYKSENEYYNNMFSGVRL